MYPNALYCFHMPAYCTPHQPAWILSTCLTAKEPPELSLIPNPYIYLLTLFTLISSSRTAYAVKIVLYYIYPVHSTIQYCSFFTDMCLEW